MFLPNQKLFRIVVRSDNPYWMFHTVNYTNNPTTIQVSKSTLHVARRQIETHTKCTVKEWETQIALAHTQREQKIRAVQVAGLRGEWKTNPTSSNNKSRLLFAFRALRQAGLAG